jgi:co-chaperonin GroES (HSP10)
MDVIPLNKRVIIKRDPLAEKKIGSIYLPDENSLTKYPSTGKILKVSKGVSSVSSGDRVLFGDGAYQYFDKEKDLILVNEDDILAVIDA